MNDEDVSKHARKTTTDIMQLLANSEVAEENFNLYAFTTVADVLCCLLIGIYETNENPNSTKLYNLVNAIAEQANSTIRALVSKQTAK